jgi:hypothetical protein
MTDLEIFAFRYNEDLGRKAAVEVAKTAAFVIAGGGDQDTLPKAKIALSNPEAAREAFIWYIALDVTVQGDPSDANIASVIATFYGDLWAPEA